MSRRNQVTVIGNWDANPKQYELGVSIGKLCAELDLVVISGGRTGLMEAVAKGCHENNGISIGLLPSEKFEDSNQFNHIVIPTGIGYARNSMNVLAADLVIVVGGASGTLSEMAYAWCYKKPMVVLTGGGGWGDELVGKSMDHRWDYQIEGASDL
ncbi:MAG: TIGR00725 family protein, partial [Bacteroidota bacterium]